MPKNPTRNHLIWERDAQPEGCWLRKQRGACCATKTGGVVPLVNTKIWYNIRRFMGEKTQENSVMGYSAAYPTGAERTVLNHGPESVYTTY